MIGGLGVGGLRTFAGRVLGGSARCGWRGLRAAPSPAGVSDARLKVPAIPAVPVGAPVAAAPGVIPSADVSFEAPAGVAEAPAKGSADTAAVVAEPLLAAPGAVGAAGESVEAPVGGEEAPVEAPVVASPGALETAGPFEAPGEGAPPTVETPGFAAVGGTACPGRASCGRVPSVGCGSLGGAAAGARLGGRLAFGRFSDARRPRAGGARSGKVSKKPHPTAPSGTYAPRRAGCTGPHESRETRSSSRNFMDACWVSRRAIAACCSDSSSTTYKETILD